MDNLEFQSLELKDFTGGETDFPFDAPSNKWAQLENTFLDQNNKPYTRYGSDSYILNTPELTTGPMRPHNLPVLRDQEIFVAAEDRILYESPTDWLEIIGDGGNPAFSTGAGSSTVQSSFDDWASHLIATNDLFSLPVKVFKDGTGTYRAQTLGLPEPPTFTATPSSSGSASYIYYVVYKYTYQVGTTTFEVRSAPKILQVLNAGSIGTHSISLAGLTDIVNAGGSNYDVLNIDKEIYRTTNGGSVAYLVTTLSHGTTTFVDNVTDNTIQTNNIIFYGSLGIRFYDAPPLAKYVHIMNGRAYFAYTKEGTDEQPTAVYQSIPNLPDAVPRTFLTKVRDTIKGISSFSNNVIVFGTTKVYRFDGFFDDFGKGGVTYDEISKVTGAINNNSIVQTDEGVFFAGNSGFFFTDGFKVMKISKGLDIRYKNFLNIPNAPERIKGSYDPLNRRVYWAMQLNAASNENDSIVHLDLRQPITEDSTFLTWTGGTQFQPATIGVIKDTLVRGQAQGFILKHQQQFVNDPKIDPLLPYVDWKKIPVIYQIKSRGMDFGLPQIRKWVTRILTTIRNVSNLSLQIISINDDTSVPRELKPIRFRNSIIWGDPTVIWGDPSIIWFFQGLIENVRRFPRDGLRCSYKQILLTNANVIITNSDLNCPINFDTNTLIATLTNPTRVLNYSAITNVNVGDSVVGVTTLALGTVLEITAASIKVQMVSGDFTGETSLNDLTTGGNAVISTVNPLISWPLDVDGFSLQFQPTPQDDPEEYPVTLPIAQRIDNQNLLLDNTSGALNQYLPLNFNDIKWYLRGTPKNEVLSLQNIVLYFAPLTPSQRQFQTKVIDEGINQ